MKKLLLSLSILIATLTAKAQNQNAMAFDGIDDYVSVTGASNYVVGSTGMSLTCWVYTQNTAPNYPNFDGFAGFRNDVDADFYLVQVGANAIEARFRNDQGTPFTITSQSLTPNQWIHFTLTYDGATMRLYKNTVKVDSIAANGVISNGGVDFNIGNVQFTSASFLLTGKMDETSFWSRALSPEEIRCIPVNGIDTNAANLELYYRFNQGTAAGNNTSITSLHDENGQQDGTFNGLALTGGISNFIAGANTATTTTAYICPGATYVYNGTTLTQGGIYADTLINSQGCDSIVQLNLVQLLVDTGVTQNGFTLTANHTSPTYKWLDCNNGYAVIPGATSQSFTPTTPGSYAVVISQSGCTDTSNCHVMATVGLNTINPIEGVSVYPTITSSELNIQLNQSYDKVQIDVIDLTGRVVTRTNADGLTNTVVDVNTLMSGSYVVRINADGRNGVYRFVKK
jgi:Concanavalin A-like lectin/glucanases superfamily/Secretion system C-terminal sorting domain